MTPQERADDIMKRCWWQVERDGPHPGFKGLDVEIRDAIVAAAIEEHNQTVPSMQENAVTVEREACAETVENYRGAFRDSTVQKVLADVIRARGDP